jgi:type I restriction-modification system DNA methylase subunit
MNLFNKKLLAQYIARYDFPHGEKLEAIQSTLSKWQKALKDSNLERTKETSIQAQFLNKFFESILGYDTQSSANEIWHLTYELTTEVDAQETDGALGFFTKNSVDNRVSAVIELKDARTSLDKKQLSRVHKLTPVEQAFQYLNKFDGCKWVIVSNFREIRLYSKSRGQGFYEKFDIINLTEEQEFKRFYFVLNKANLIGDGDKAVIDTLVEDTTAQEENITKKFYQEYKDIRLKVLNHLFDHNPDVDRLVLIEKTQKLLDRLIFTMVCEDSATLLPVKLVKNTYERAFQSFALSDSDQRVWSEFKGLFAAIDKGNNRVKPPINAYNGGLFKADDILDNLILKDEIWVEIIKLTNYDFESDLNVNVLGHIFEQSISDLEEIKASVDGTELDEKKSLRKKQGIFYTPEYITKFIVENTVGKYLEENPQKLESIKILDPACGSGAFLNQAHSFLLNQYKVRDEEKQLELQKQGKATSFFDLSWVENDKSILLNNLYGVDLSPESVEITKLALWLKTAKATEPLQNLDSNIKCGNSLIDDPEVAGKRAFNWNKEYKDIMEEGGFDVIVGNPPYVTSRNQAISEKEKRFYKNNYQTLEDKPNTYLMFIDRAISLLKTNGYLGLIIPNSWLGIDSAEKVRKLLIKAGKIISIINLHGIAFSDASVETMVLLFQKSKPLNGHKVQVSTIQIEKQDINEKGNFINQSRWENNRKYYFDISSSDDEYLLIEKLNRNQKLSFYFNVRAGLQAYEKGKGTPPQTDKDVESHIFDTTYKVDSSTFKYLQGKDISRYYMLWGGSWLRYGTFLSQPRTLDIFSKPRLLIREITGKFPHSILATYASEVYLNNKSIINILSSDNGFSLLVLLAILNSKLMSFYFIKRAVKSNRTLFPKLVISDIRNLPIVKPNNTLVLEIEKLVKNILNLKVKFVEEINRTKEVLETKLNIKVNTILNSFFHLGWNEFVAELEKQKVKLDVNEQDRLNQWFNKIRKSLLDLEQKINDLDREIDFIMYKLFELDSDEIDLVENT